MGTDITKNELPTEVRQYIDALEERVEELGDEVEKSDEALTTVLAEFEELEGSLTADALSKSDDDDAFEVAVSKADPTTRAILVQQREQIQKADAAIAKAEAERFEADIVSKSEDLRYVHVAKTDESDEGIVTVLKTAYAVSSDYGDRLFEVLKHASRSIEQGGLFSEIGTAGAQTTVSKSVEASAAALRKDNPDMTLDEALASVYESDPSLYEQAKQEG